MRRPTREATAGLATGLPAGWLLGKILRGLTSRRANPTSGGDGLVVLQIDGLAAPLLKRALAEGRMPTIARWLQDGSHRVAPWTCALPSQTSASQAGILYGDNFDIPAFRWYEKENQRLRVSNHPVDAAAIAQRLSNGHGLLSGDGTSISNLVGGDAAHSLLTMSSFAVSNESLPRRAATYYSFFLNPVTVLRTLLLMLYEILVEIWEGQSQRLRRTRPRVRRGLSIALLRSISNVLLRELDVYLIRHELAAGSRVIYCDFVGYDEVAHHAGPERSDALRVLWGIDRSIAGLERAAARAPRHYHFVVLSDHGQSQGATFHDRCGQTLEQLLTGLVGEDRQVQHVSGRGEGLGHLSALLSEFLRAGRLPGLALRRLFRLPNDRDYVALSPHSASMEGAAPSVVACASGNLAMVYFTEQRERLGLEAIRATYPGVIEGLLAQKEIGFILVHSDQDGAVVLGEKGTRYLNHNRVEGGDPLAPFGLQAAGDLLRLDSFPHVGDLAINSFVDPETNEVAAVEELVGTHGGLGGLQTQAFVLFPAQWNAGAGPIRGAPAVHALLRNWLDGLVSGKGGTKILQQR